MKRSAWFLAVALAQTGSRYRSLPDEQRRGQRPNIVVLRLATPNVIELTPEASSSAHRATTSSTASPSDIAIAPNSDLFIADAYENSREILENHRRHERSWTW